MLENPFITYGYESAEYFCDRVAETSQLTSLLINGNHTALISPRRMGKTGLLHHCFAQPPLNHDYYTFLIDIYATKSLQDMVYQMGHSIVKRLKPRGQAALDRFLQVVTSLRTGISFDGQGNASWNLDIGEIKSPAFTLDEIFNYLQSADKPCIVAIDEFQAIAQYPEHNTEAMMRTYVQQCRNARFVFSGSQQSMMSEMFSSPARPFYQSVSLMFLRPVAAERYEAFARKHFSDYGKLIEDGVVSSIHRRFDGVTWYIQKMLNQLFAITPTRHTATADDIDTAENQIINQNEEAYKDTIYQLTARQRDLLVAISHEQYTQKITGAAFIKRYHLSTASSVQKAAAALLSKQLITHQLGTYEVYDKFLAAWLRRY
jgi:hypothetical protein